MNVHSLSVVIATLGGASLSETIMGLNRGGIVPAEILVCIPEDEAHRVAESSLPNVRIVKTPCRGQVPQRAIGLQQTAGTLVMQLDDDITFGENALSELVAALERMGPGNVVAPVYHDRLTRECSHSIDSGWHGLLRNILLFVICGAPWGIRRMGKATPIGTCYGVDGNYCGTAPFETEWLPGGCVLSFKSDLVTESFFPYPGKAYCEDLIHSFLRRKKGVKHWVIPQAHCYIEIVPPDDNEAALTAQAKARRYYVEQVGGSLRRLAFYEMFMQCKRVVAKCLVRR